MKVVLIGGSSPSTPVFFEALAAMPDALRMEIVLLGRSECATAAVARASKILSGTRRLEVKWSLTGRCDWEREFEGADVIVLQIRVGGYEGRDFFETFPLRYGVCGDQALGPGGLAAAWCAWPEVERFCRVAESRAPGSLFVILTSPVGILVRLAVRASPSLNVVGICELPWSLLEEIATALNVSPHAIDFDYFGLNHLGWFYRLSLGTRNLLAEYLERCVKEEGFPGKSLVRRYGGIPTRYWRLHEEAAQVAIEQRSAAGTRGEFLAAYRVRALEVFREGGKEEIRAVLRERPAPWYSEALAPFLLSMAGGETAVPLFLSTRQAGLVSQFGDEDVLEMAHSVRDNTPVRRPLCAAVPAEVAKVIGRYVHFERVAASAVSNHDRLCLVEALRVHPWTRGDVDVGAMAEEILRAADGGSRGEPN